MQQQLDDQAKQDSITAIQDRLQGDTSSLMARYGSQFAMSGGAGGSGGGTVAAAAPAAPAQTNSSFGFMTPFVTGFLQNNPALLGK